MATKATHTGTCQVCGSGQLLPGGVLSLHGYTVEWNFFNGVCPGAKHLPFEVDKSLIEGAIARAEAQLQLQQEQAAALRDGPATTKAWISVYRPATWENRKSGYDWYEVEVTAIDKEYGSDVTVRDFTFVNPKTQKVESVNRNSSIAYGLKNVADVTRLLNAQRAERVHVPAIKQLTHYIKWQQARIANWAPTPLTPRKEGKGGTVI